MGKPISISKQGGVVIIVLIALVSVVGYFIFSQLKNKEVVQPTPDISLSPVAPAEAPASNFAAYKETPVNISPKIPAYSVNQDLGNIVNVSDFQYALSSEVKSSLAKNGFVVKPGYEPEFFSLYERNRYNFIPNFITTDSILHNYHLMFDFLLRKLEEEKLTAVLKELNYNMLLKAQEQYKALLKTSWKNAAKRNVGFFAVGSKLLDPTVAVPSLVSAEVEQELALIKAHEGIASSPVMNMGSEQGATLNTPQGQQSIEELKEDYSQYVPRGHYSKTEQLKAYFKSMIWYGRLTFRLKNEDEIKSAVLVTLALNQGQNKTAWEALYEPINFFVGKSDDITYYQFKDLMGKTYGQEAALQTVGNDQEKFAAFVALTKNLTPPQINSMPIFSAAINPDREKEIKGFRFMGQRFTIDAAIFQRLVTREVGPKGEPCANAPFNSGRMLPKGLDIPAAMGSDEALNILDGQGDTKLACYSENMAKMRQYIAGLKINTWAQNLYWGWLYSLLSLTEEKLSGYPSFMRNSSWARKELNTYLGSWTELKHDTILYAKQVYAELGGGAEPPEEKDDRGYVEPNPYVYGRLASLLQATKEGLETRELLSDKNKGNLEIMKQLVISLKTISEKELNNIPLTSEEYELIRSYGGQLEHFWLLVNKEEMEAKGMVNDQRNYLTQNPAALIADVATDPNGFVLEEATGRISEIYAVVPLDGKLRITKGGVYSYYEFLWPMSDRLTDEKWREVMNSEKAPSLPEWTKVFMAK